MSRPKAGLPSGLRCYRVATAAAEPFARAWLRLRAPGRGLRERERLGEAGASRPAGDLLWLHGVSVGESLSLLPLLTEIARIRPELGLLVTSRTRTSAEVLEQRLPAGVLQSFAPLDLPRCLGRFLDAWKPGALVLAESELWPGLICACREASVPVVLVNARMSDRSVRNWRRFPDSARYLLEAVEFAEAQDRTTARRLAALGARPGSVGAVGSLKAAGGPPPADPVAVRTVSRALEGRLTWLAASTHAADEAVVLDAHERVLEACPNSRLILVPRHPQRGGENAAAAESRGWRVARRSAGAHPGGGETVYVADTLGELGLWYRVAPVAFVGGSFGGIGGHNPFEPAALGCAILHGGDVENFRDIYRELDRGGGAHRVEDGGDLARFLVRSLDCEGRPHPSVRRLTSRASTIAAPEAGGTERLARRILGVLGGLAGDPGATP